MINSVIGYNQIHNQKQHNYYVASGVSSDFAGSVFSSVERLKSVSPKLNNALSGIDNIIILKDSNSYIPDEFAKTRNKLNRYAQDAYGFVSRQDGAVVLNQDNHNRKDVRLEGSIESQASDTLTHEIGHSLDDEFSTSDAFIAAYMQDLEQIDLLLKSGVKEIYGEDLEEMIKYLKHYMEGVDFSDGIDKNDLTREGLRENFAECVSTITDDCPSKINYIYSALFPNTMKKTAEYVL